MLDKKFSTKPPETSSLMDISADHLRANLYDGDEGHDTHSSMICFLDIVEAMAAGWTVDEKFNAIDSEKNPLKGWKVKAEFNHRSYLFWRSKANVAVIEERAETG